MISHIDTGRTAEERKKTIGSLIRKRLITLGGYKKVKIYGLLTCSSGKKMKVENRVFFTDEAEALANGYRPCGHCMKQKYAAWKKEYDSRQGSDKHLSEGDKINVRDKNTMRRRLHNTRMTAPGNVHIKAWAPDDISEPITYEYAPSLFGEILIAATSKGICYLGFTNNNRMAAASDLKKRFPQNNITEGTSPFQDSAIIQMNDPQMSLPIQLHLKGTAFQLDIWKKLVQIPLGGLTTYTQLGGSNKVVRAAGAAVGSNPVGFLLPCHRVVYADGSFNSYFWGTELKEKLLAWEANRTIL